MNDTLVARSIEECHLYMELHPCECGEEVFDWSRHRLEQRTGEHPLFSVYEGSCGNCGVQRRFEFAVPVQPVQPAQPAVPGRYGGEEPSRIVDPGEFLWSSERAAAGVPADPGELAADVDPDDAYDAVELAVAGVIEVLKFLPPGADSVPPEAFSSPLGRRMYDADPGRFGRDRLNSVLADYRRIRDRLADALGE